MNHDRSRATNALIEIPKPEGLDYLPYQKAGVAYSVNKSGVLIADEMGLGKLQPITALLPTPYGFKMMGDIKVGDTVFGTDGHPIKVTNVYPQGVKDIYRVTFRDGSHVDCGLEHLWTVRDYNFRRDGWKTLTTKELLKRGLKTSGGHCKYKVPLQGAAQFEGEAGDVDPYMLGALIGDGYCPENGAWNLTLGVRDAEDIVSNLPANQIGRVYQHAPTVIKVFIPAATRDLYQNIGLYGKSRTKRIPPFLFTVNIMQRKQMLYGLMDTDGSCIKNRTIYHTVNKGLAEDVKRLVHSLGGVAIIREYDRTSEEKGLEYQVNVKTNFCPFTVEHKASEWKPAEWNKPTVTIESIEFIGKEESQCIAVDAPDRLYQTGIWHTVTHNTIQAIGIANYNDSKTILVICPSSLKYNWKKELEKWLVKPLEVEVATSKSYPAYADVLIINYDILKKFRTQLRSKVWDLLIVDESHNIKNSDAQRTKELVGGNIKVPVVGEDGKPLKTPTGRNKTKLNNVPPIEATKKVFLTGTPVLNKPAELWTTCNFLAPDVFPDQWGFWNRYCDYKREFGRVNVEGRDNMAELQSKLRDNFMIRRLKKDVLKDLPDKLRQVIEIPPSECGLKGEELKKLKVAMDHELEFMHENNAMLSNLKAIAEQAEKAHDLEGYTNAVRKLKHSESISFYKMAKIRKEVAIAKVPLMIKVIEEELESVDKLVVFAHHHEVASAVYERFKGNSVRITGQIIDPKQRQAAADRFQTDPSVNLCICTIKAAGVGFTLTAASTVIFMELDWVPANLLQAEDRCILEGQPILTPKGWVKIEDVSVGDEVINMYGNRTKVIDAWNKSLRKPLTTIDVVGYGEISTTHDHPFCINGKGWVNAEDIRVGDKICMPSQLFENDEKTELLIPQAGKEIFQGPFGAQRNARYKRVQSINLSEDALFAIGYFCGDGFARHSNSGEFGSFISFAGNKSEKLKHIERIKKWANDELRLNTNLKFSKTKDSVELRAYSKDLAKYFKESFGHGAQNKILPEFIFDLSKSQQKVVLEGLESSDGYFRGSFQEYSTISESLASGVFRLALNCGYMPTIRRVNNPSGTQSIIIGYAKSGNSKSGTIRSVKSHHGKKSQRVYDLTVEEASSFVVGPAVVHNCHRIGQEGRQIDGHEKNAVLVQHYVLKGSIDSKMANKIVEKQNLIDRILDEDQKEVLSTIAITPEL